MAGVVASIGESFFTPKTWIQNISQAHINHLNRGEGHERISVANNAPEVDSNSEAKRLHRMGLQSILYLTPTPSQQKGERSYFIGRGLNLVIEQASNGGWNPTRCVSKAKGWCELSVSWIWEALASGTMDRGHGGRRKAALFWLRSEVGGRRRGRPTETTKSDNKTTNEKWETTTVVMASPKFLFSSTNL